MGNMMPNKMSYAVIGYALSRYMAQGHCLDTGAQRTKVGITGCAIGEFA